MEVKSYADVSTVSTGNWRAVCVYTDVYTDVCKFTAAPYELGIRVTHALLTVYDCTLVL